MPSNTWTMVSRKGDPNTSATRMTYLCISGLYYFRNFTGSEIVEGLKTKQLRFNNMGVESGELVSTNGDIKRYTHVDSQDRLLNKPSAVILDRAEKNGELEGFTVYMADGLMEEANVAKALKIGQTVGFANAKVVNDKVISAIRGTFPLRQIIVETPKEEAKRSIPKLDILYIGSFIGKTGASQAYASVVVSYPNAKSMVDAFPMLVKSNKHLMESFNENVPGGAPDSLAITRGPDGGRYVVMRIETLRELLKASKGKFTNSFGNTLMISCTDYTTDSDGVESHVKMDSKDLRPVSKHQGTEAGFRKVKEIANDFMLATGKTARAEK